MIGGLHITRSGLLHSQRRLGASAHNTANLATEKAALLRVTGSERPLGQGVISRLTATEINRFRGGDLHSGVLNQRTLRAVDRDLNYSQPAEVRLTVVPDSRDERIDELENRVRERTMELEETHAKLEETQNQLITELEKELQDAHDMQMNLMQKDPPKISGLSLGGRCFPATHVGGDLFQFFHIGNRLAIGLADVTGHAMKAAVPVMIFSGVLDSQMETPKPIAQLFTDLNRSLCRTLGRRTFICFSMVEIDTNTRSMRLANCGCPYPFHFHAASGEVTEMQVEAYPLGVRPDTEYDTVDGQLEPGDRLVFCSDGIVEATNVAGEMFTFERTEETVRRGCQEGLAAEALLERILAEVRTFAGDAPQADDQTVVVLQVEA